jgi:hypothetical protein
MGKEAGEKNVIVKEESVGYLKTKVNLQQGVLFLTSNRISLKSRKSRAKKQSVSEDQVKNKTQNEATFFDLDIDKIQSVHNGKQEMKNDVLEITDEHNITHRILVKNSQEWLDVIKLH